MYCRLPYISDGSLLSAVIYSVVQFSSCLMFLCSWSGMYVQSKHGFGYVWYTCMFRTTSMEICTLHDFRRSAWQIGLMWTCIQDILLGDLVYKKCCSTTVKFCSIKENYATFLMKHIWLEQGLLANLHNKHKASE